MFANENEYVRVPHRVPVHEAVHVHVLPALQAPPFKQTGEQTAKQTKNNIVEILFLFSSEYLEMRIIVQRTCCACCTGP